MSKIRKWSKTADPKVVNLVAWILVIIQLGLFVYLGHLLTDVMDHY